MEENKVFEVRDLCFSYEEKIIFESLNLQIKQGAITTFMGANGCGKSTLFNLLTKNLKPTAGMLAMEGVDFKEISIKEYAKKAAIVHQYNTAIDDITVEEVVAYGRLPYHKILKSNAEKVLDEEKVQEAFRITGIYDMRNQMLNSLSGGQCQRVWIAMALAQDTKILLLDEPTTYLDIRYQLEILKLIKELNEIHGITIIMVLHDINQALSYSDEIIALSPDGKVIEQGDPESVITTEVLKQIYGVQLPIAEIEGKPFAICV